MYFFFSYYFFSLFLFFIPYVGSTFFFILSRYLLSVLGLYSLVPGTRNYVLGSPLFGHVQISLENGRFLDIIAVNNSASFVYVESVSFNGTLITGKIYVRVFFFLPSVSVSMYISV